MQLLEPNADKIVLWGMSCSGKTTFAQQLVTHTVYTFDFHFPWHDIETFGLSTEAALKHVRDQVRTPNQFVIDGWHLADPLGNYIPQGSTIYVIYAPYDRIIEQYRVPVDDHEQHRHMFRKWYKKDFVPGTRYFLNDGEFMETTKMQYITFVKRSR